MHTYVTFVLFTALTTTPVTIGLEQLQYTVSDTTDYQFVCAEVRFGSVAGRDIEMQYIVSDAGMQYNYRKSYCGVYMYYQVYSTKNRWHSSSEWHPVIY